MTCDLLRDDDLMPTNTTRQGRPEYRLARELVYSDSEQAPLRVPPGYVTDKYSLPGRLIPAIWQPHHAKFATAAVIHDWLFETKLLPFHSCNAVFSRAMKACGVKMHHRFIAWAMVSLFGGRGYGLVDADNMELVSPLRPDLARRLK